MTHWMYTERDRPRVLIAGGGVAALEACLFIRAYLSEAEAEIELLSCEEHFAYRPLAVLEPFAGASTWSLRLDRFAADQDAVLVGDRLAAVRADERVVVTASATRRPYDLLLLATGARTEPAVPGALTFSSSADGPALRRMLDDAAALPRPRIVFALPSGPHWALPLYELALMAAADLRDRGVGASLTLVTPEASPLGLFGSRASAAVGRLLEDHDIEVVTHAEPVLADPDGLQIADGRRIPADGVVALPRVVGRVIDGVPHGPDGFVAVDEHGRVEGLDGVYAAGDVTSSPLKQGGLAAQQADAAAEAMLAELGLPIVPRPYTPVLHGVLYTDREPAYMSARLDAPSSESPAPRSYSLWWPPSKIAGRFLSAYLTLRAGAPRAPETRPSADIVPVHVDVARAVGVHLAGRPTSEPDARPG